jgi:hypothetical protein
VCDIQGLIEVVADLLHINRGELLMEVARSLPSETMSLAKQGSQQASADRHSMLRYATSMISAERRVLLAWREEAEICREERRQEEEARKAAEEQAKRAEMKMKKPHDMGLFEGGKPTAVKTLGGVIAHIYENKVASDDLCDKHNRPRESMMAFLRHYFIRQYGITT